jgi:hypothetical protein
VEDRDERSKPDADVDAHKKQKPQAMDEPKAEGESDDDVEAHKKYKPQASAEPKSEGESDDDFEAHKKRGATEEIGAEGESDDFEAHRKVQPQ